MRTPLLVQSKAAQQGTRPQGHWVLRATTSCFSGHQHVNRAIFTHVRCCSPQTMRDGEAHQSGKIERLQASAYTSGDSDLLGSTGAIYVKSVVTTLSKKPEFQPPCYLKGFGARPSLEVIPTYLTHLPVHTRAPRHEALSGSSAFFLRPGFGQRREPGFRYTGTPLPERPCLLPRIV